MKSKQVGRLMFNCRSFSFANSAILLLLLCLPGTLSAKDVTLAWDPNPGADTAGYMVYYRPDPNLSQQGADITRIDVGSSTSTVINGLAEDRLFYFAVTAYNNTGVESAFSNIVANGWIPVAKYPVNQAVPGFRFTFSWSDPPPDTMVTYTLYYGTDPDLNPGAAVAGPPAGPSARPPLADPGTMTVTLILLLTGTLVAIGAKRPGRAPALALMGAVAILASCGGGGPTITEHTSGEAKAGTTRLTTVSNLDEPFYEATNLAPGTYYWKVVADDGQLLREGLKSQFVIQ
jgi:hypothetical protein